MITRKQKIELFKQSLINRINVNYRKNFIKAERFTRTLGIEPPNFIYDPSFERTEGEKQEVANALTYYFYEYRKLNLENMAGLCMVRSHEIQDFLRDQFSVNTVITNGNVYDYNYHNTFSESKSAIKKRLFEKQLTKIGFHTWLTLPNYEVIDVTIGPTMWAQYDQSLSTEEKYRSIVWTQPLTDRKPFIYKPQFLGYEYFKQIPIAAELRHIHLKD